MKIYDVTYETNYGSATFSVKAENEHDARSKANHVRFQLNYHTTPIKVVELWKQLQDLRWNIDI